PHWRADARGAVFGLTRATSPAELARAAVEAVCYQTRDLFAAMAEDGVRPAALKVDGGMVANTWMCQFLADILDLPVDRPEVMETTALGAAYLAGLKSDIYPSTNEIAGRWKLERRFTPALAAGDRDALVKGWTRAVNATLNY
ncbi:MAG: glycerol kinase, partial [Caulobacterales bacterium]|nr:glycerol kinase [Caulobacterales bacterium]